MDKEIVTIHIEWDGPFSLEGNSGRPAAKLTNRKRDRGVYQVYGGNHIYGGIALLYIGLTVEQTFAKRIGTQEQPQLWQWNRDAGRVEIYVGRLAGGKTPASSIWNQHITYAEQLLILAHQPPMNTQKNFRTAEGLKRVHILNWGRYRDLLPEVSGARWTNRFDDIRGYHLFGD